MCVSSIGKEFLGAIDTLGHTKVAWYILEVMKRHLIGIGLGDVVQIYTDNTSLMHKAVIII